MILTSSANERIKHARRVREGREPGLIFIEGERLVEEAVAASSLRLVACFHSPTPSERMQRSLAQMSCEIIATDDRLLASLSDTQNTQGIIVIAERPQAAWADLWARAGSAAPLIVAFDRVQDPGNFGTLLRTAEAAGAHGIVALAGCVDGYSPKVLRSAMGSAFRLPIITDVTSETLLAACTERGVQVIAAAAGASVTHCDWPWAQPTLVVLGNEGNCVSEALLARCDARVSIPLHAPVESLNVAAAGAVMLFEAARQRAGAG